MAELYPIWAALLGRNAIQEMLEREFPYRKPRNDAA
jgi:hypothetical protein